MVKAMDGVKEGISVRGASMKFSVPRKTLEDSVKGRVQHGSNPGPKTVLTKVKEDSLVPPLIGKMGLPANPNNG